MSLTVIIGPMFASKTTRLILEANKYTDLGFNVLYINSKVDTRPSNDAYISTHSPILKIYPFERVKVQALKEIICEPYDVLCVDEAQFFTEEIVDSIRSWINLGKIIFVSGLDGNSKQEPFGHILKLIPLADDVIKIKAHCSTCLSDRIITLAPFTASKIELEGDVNVGGKDIYYPVCRAHLPK